MVFSLFVSTVNAQIAVTVTNNTNTTPNLATSYTSLANALTDLNAVNAMSGPITLTLAAGTENTPPTGLLLGSATLNPVLNSTNTITIIGTGATTVLNAGVGTATPASAVPDGIFKLVGADYVTLDAITFTDSNATNPATMEVGLGMFKLSATDGCNNNTIQNCIFNMQRVNNANSTAPMVEGSVGIAMMNSTALASTTVLTVTAASGASSNNKFYSNTINGGNYGIVLRGFAAASPFTLADTNNDVGGLSLATGNTVLNYGGAAAAANPAAGIRIVDQWAANVSFNTVNNNNGSGVNHVSTLRGIITSGSTSASLAINNNTITLSGGGTTSQLDGISNAAGSTAAANTININNNTLVLNYSTATGATINGIVNSATATTVNINGNNISAGSVIPGTGTHILIAGGSPINLNISNNTINNFSRSTATTGTLRGIVFTSPTTSVINNNVISNLSYTNNASTGIIDGIYGFSSSVDVTISNNQVNNLTTAGGAIRGIVEFGVAGNKNVFNNTVHTFAKTAGYVGAGVNYTAITCSVGVINLSKNKIYNISSSGASATVVGISLTGGTTNTITNNIIGELFTPTASALNAIRGIDVSGSTTSNVNYNTVMINATSSGATFGSSAISVLTTPTVVLRNNIFVNNSAVMGAGLAAAYRRSSTTLTTYDAASNNNLFYGSTIFTDGTNTDVTLAAFKTRVGTRDTASITENPTFVSTTGSNANFLHIDTAVATQIESGASPVPGITDDFDGNVRNVTTPDIGADEFTGVLADFTAPTISHTAPVATCFEGSRIISATITDASGIPTGIGSPVVYWRINAGAYNATTGVDMGAGVYNFTIGSGTVYGDVLTYYFVVQDNAASPNITALPLAGAAGFSTNPPAVSTVPTTPFSTSVVTALSGVYTVGTTGNYTTLTAAVNDYNVRCLSGAVVFNLLDATYPSETFPITIQQNADANATNTLTIKPAAGVTASISGSNTAAIIKLNGADYVTIDGSNNGSNSKDLTINNTNTGTTSAVVWNGSANASNGATNITIKNLNILGNAPLTTFVGIFSGSGTTMGAVAESANNNFIVQNNSVSKSQYGIAVAGAATGNTGNVISNNSIGSNTASDYIGFIGIFTSNNNGVLIRNNSIFNIITTANNPIGVNIAANVINSTIDSNNISGIAYTGTTGYGGKGINVNTANAASNLTISNNMISNIRGDGWNSLASTDIVVGLRIVGTTGGVNVYHNTINLGSGTFAGNTSGTFSAAFHIGSTVTSLNVRNNMFGSNLVNSAAAGAKTYAIACEAPNTIFTNIDNNNYFVSGTQGVLGYLTSDRTNLAGIVAGFGQNTASLNVTPVFVSPTNLHLVTTTNTAIDNKGTAIAAVTLDIDGDVRNVTTPDMGADEFTSTACTSANGGTISALVNTFCDSGSTTISSTGYSTGFSTSYQWQSSTDLAFTTPVNEGSALSAYADLVTPTIAATRYYRLAVTCVENGQANFSNVVTVTINITPNADAPSDVSACDSYVLPALTVGNYFTGSNGTGTPLFVGNTISSTQTIYVYAQTGTTPNCTDENSFTVTITPSTSNSTTASACDSYTWAVNGITYASSGTYTSVTGCHTETLNLTITPSTSNSTTASACDSYTWAVNGITYASSGTYTSVTGCHTETLSLTITPSTSNSTTASACDSYTWAVNGITYTSSGTYTSVTGCHTETLNLTITPSTSNSTTASACDSYTWAVNGITYTSSGTYTSVTGCHTETLNLTITTATTPTGATTQTISGGVAADATIEDIVVTGTGIVWYPTALDAANDTNAIAAGTQLVDGEDYFAVSVNGTCRSAALGVTVTVVLGTSSFDLSQLNYYPNPVKDILNVKYNKEIISIDVYDLTGRKVIEMKPNTLEVQLNMTNLSNAMYIVRLQSVDGITELKVYKN